MNFKNFKETSVKNMGIQGREADKGNVRCNNTRVSTLRSFRLYYVRPAATFVRLVSTMKTKKFRRLLLL
jgi:hypothetical protein